MLKRFIARCGVVSIQGNNDGVFVELFVIARFKQQNETFWGRSLCAVGGIKLEETASTLSNLQNEMHHRVHGTLARNLARLGGHGPERTRIEEIFRAPEWKETTEPIKDLLDRLIARQESSKNSLLIQATALGPRVCDCPHDPLPEPVVRKRFKTVVVL